MKKKDAEFVVNLSQLAFRNESILLLKLFPNYLQRPALIPFHALELKLIDGEGNWELCAIQQ
jgi:hypothetical protein